MKKTMVTRTVGSMIVLRESEETPHDEEWDAFLTLLAKHKDEFSKMRVLVVTDGGGPDAQQRKRLEKTLDGRSIRVAVVTDSAKSRFIAAIISLINKDHRGFAMKDIVEAYDHLRLTPDERQLAEIALRELTPMIR